jgi:hypothetical protein
VSAVNIDYSQDSPTCEVKRVTDPNDAEQVCFGRCRGVPPNVGYIRKWVTMKSLKSLLSPEFSILRATSLEPEGHRGMLRIVNTPWLNRRFESIIGASRVKR